MTDAVLTDVRDRTLVITLNRPDAMNAINGNVTTGLVAAFDRLENDSGLRIGILTGNGKGFCSGLDLKAFAVGEGTRDLEALLARSFAKPLICAVEGFALAGGFELALMCDLLVAGRDSRFGLPEVKVGLFAAGGGLIRLAQRVPHGIASELALTGDTMTADRAHAAGLVTAVSEPGEALERSMSYAERIARNAPLAIAATRQILRSCAGRTEAEMWEMQKPLMKQVFRSNDAKEGPRAFAEKRPPSWTNS